LLLLERVLLFDVKTTHGGGEIYFTPRARDLSRASGAVAERAWRVDLSYHHHARRLDLIHSPRGTHPIEDWLGTFTRVRGLVFGQYGEASEDVHALLSQAAHSMARRVRVAGLRCAHTRG
jgi:hypothetical protein